jgi:hypothetical protein
MFGVFPLEQNLIDSSAISTPEALGAATRIKADMHSATVHDLINVVHEYVMKFVSDLRQIGGFLWVLRFPSPIKLTTMITGSYKSN